MAAPITLEQIIAELSVKRPPQPWDTPMGGAPPGMHRMPGGQMMSDAAMGSIADQPMAQAAKREELMKSLAPMGALANPESEGKGSGLIRLLMGLMGQGTTVNSSDPRILRLMGMAPRNRGF